MIGRASSADETAPKHLNQIWNKLNLNLPSEVLTHFSQDQITGFLNYSITRGRTFIQDKLSFPLKDLIRDPERLNAEIRSVFSEKHPIKSKAELAARQRIQNIIYCREMEVADYSFRFRDGQFIADEKRDCGKWHLDHPFHAKDWPITRPIFYISGENDPVTPLFQTQAHMDSQPMAPRLWITLPEGGHNKIGETLHDCKEALWKSIRLEGHDIIRVLSQCKATPKLLLHKKKGSGYLKNS